MTKNPLNDLSNGLGDYLREQRESAKLSVRQLSEIAGVSNPYLSQIERGLKKPSADILQQIAKGLQVSAESLYIRAGLLDPDEEHPPTRPTVIEAVKHDAALTGRQKSALLDIYESFVTSTTTAAIPEVIVPPTGTTAAGEGASTRTSRRSSPRRTSARQGTTARGAAPEGPTRAGAARTRATTSSPTEASTPKPRTRKATKGAKKAAARPPRTSTSSTSAPDATTPTTTSTTTSN